MFYDAISHKMSVPGGICPKVIPHCALPTQFGLVAGGHPRWYPLFSAGFVRIPNPANPSRP